MRLLCTVLLMAAIVVPAASQTSGPLELSLRRAVEIAIAPEGNTNIQLSGEALRQAESRSDQARATLMPDLSASFRTQNMTVNLSAMGVRLSAPVPGIQFPRFVGPFSTMDARLSATQSVLDFSLIRRYQASRTAASAARQEHDSSEELVAAQVARVYLAALRAEADVAVAEANIELSEAVLEQAQNQKIAGTGTGIEITRARVQMADDRQRLLVFQNARRSAHLQLLRAMGLDLETEIRLTDTLSFVPFEEMTVERACTLALDSRPDYRAQLEREASARISANAVGLERLPTLSAFGDYGSNGNGFDNALPTRTFGISLRFPIFDGGRRSARRAESNSLYRAEQIRTNDLKQEIELAVRLSLDALRSAAEQVKVAEDGLQLAEQELAQARVRYDAGVANSLEVTDAQTRLERARDNRTQALYSFNVARLDFAQATGTVRRTLP